MKDGGDNVLLEFGLPGFKRDDIKIKFHGKSVSIRASMKSEILEERTDYLHDEKMSSVFTYESSLPKNVDTRKAKIDFNRGILRIRIPKFRKS